MKSTRRTIWAVILIFSLLTSEPEIVHADNVGDSFASNNYSSFFDTGFEYNTVEKDRYEITYCLNGGMITSFCSKSYATAELPYFLPIPSRPGYNFAGWFTESSFINKVNMIDDIRYGDVTLYAKWTREIDAAYNVQMYSYTTASMLSGNDRELKDCSYSFVDELTIPGMPSTRESDYMNNLIATDGQCPQGICITDDYYLITAYCEDDHDSPGSLYVFDVDTGEYLATLGMKNDSHLGGLAFDGTHVWICHSNSRTLECISYSYIKEIAMAKPQAAVDATGIFKEYQVSNVPSCMTYHDGKLWVATHNIYFQSVMVAYRYMGDSLKKLDSYQIPDKVQGIAFGEDDQVYLSTSFGRTKSSYLKIYRDVLAMDKNPNAPVVKVEMPPCSEEITIADGNVYILFESASEKYFEGTDGNGNSIAPIDKVLALDTASIGS